MGCYIIILNYAQKELLMFEKMVHKMLQCDLSKAVGSWVNFILSLTLFPTFPHPEFLTSVMMTVFSLFKKVTFFLGL